ncbi:hypothetical protein N7541_002819 [Penicillium brevicompactum]|uniref:Fungal N-terminal domain-containing protein n=1 Tax=Penicillium brevicompactum TaxID=5074 RepID=A0A9W9V0H5_PENBR|nr:hypothetical protein N7541_002819 [Penicillium brevicompactum]
MASLSVGDIVLCSQIVYRLLAAATVGRRDAPRDIRELDNVLLALNLSLDHLCKVAAVDSSQQNDMDPSAVDIRHNLKFMIQSCRQTLEDLERTTFKYREMMRTSRSTNRSSSSPVSQVSRLKSQWRRFMWDLRGESLASYRKKLETHTAAINLMLNTCIW